MKRIAAVLAIVVASFFVQLAVRVLTWFDDDAGFGSARIFVSAGSVIVSLWSYWNVSLRATICGSTSGSMPASVSCIRTSSTAY